MTEDEVLISPHLPSFTGQRQSWHTLVAFLARHSLAAATVIIPIPVHPGNDRLHHRLARNEEKASRIRHGLVVACVGILAVHLQEAGGDDAEIDRAVRTSSGTLEGRTDSRLFSPMATMSGVRSPGFNLLRGV
jgi:aminopeptidase-like protein